jgi:WD40 repeat protein
MGETVWSVGVKGDSIAWGNRWTKKNGKSKLQKTLNLKTFSIEDSPVALGEYSRISTTQADNTLSDRLGGDYGYKNAVLELKKDSKVVASITRDATNGFGHYCYGFYGKYIISGGAGGHLIIYDREGKEEAKLIGHTGMVWSIAVEGDRLVTGGGDQTIRIWDLSQIEEQQVIYPQLNLFISKENEYIAWSESGYFTSSTGGDKYVGYHINQGDDKEARYVGSDKYFDTLYRPDIITLILETGSENKAIALARKKRKVESVDIANSLPPVLSLLSASNIKTDQKRILIEYSTQSKDPITKTIITLNGKQLTARDIVSEQTDQKHVISVELEDGENIIAIKAKNKFAMSDEILIYANKTGKKSHIYKPTLYLLSIGISTYENEAYNLGVADKDALSMTEMFKKQSGKIYKDVQVKTLINEKANSDDILDGLDWIDKEATSKDIVIIFIAGHGVNDDKGNYYFLSHEANLERLRRTAVKWTEIQDTISNLPSKVILLADTCHSTGTRRDITSAIKSIMNSGTGSIIMTATTGSGYSYEQKSWGHGAFTKALLEGIDQTKADYDKDQSVTIKEIDLYITNRVKELTKGKQKPTTITPQSIPDFAIGVK